MNTGERIKGFFTNLRLILKQFLGGGRAMAKFEDVQQRRSICQDCEFLRGAKRKTQICESCGCLIRLKIMFTTSECPEKKWGSFEY